MKIAVVIPTYRACNHILSVLKEIGPEVSQIYVVDDCCPDASGEFVLANCKDNRVAVIRHLENKGVGGAVMTGYQAAIKDGMNILVKIDSDGQMDPSLISNFVGPILNGKADYTKGNRFFNLESLEQMPKIRLFGNAILSFMTKISSGYWNVFDPTNGYTAIHANLAKQLPFSKINNRYFFESDMLFRLNILRAVVIDVPMDALYSNEVSGLKIHRIIGEFARNHAANFVKRIFYNYYLRDMSIASIELPLGIALFLFGITFGALKWFVANESNISTPSGTVMLSALPILMGIQFLLSFLAFDISSIPNVTRASYEVGSLVK